MLSDILDLCRNSPQGIGLDEIARQSNKDPSVVEGMVNQLLQMGKLIKRPGRSICDLCPSSSSCILLKSPEGMYFIPMDTIQEYNQHCLQVHSPDQGSEHDIR
jgi:hypothetical protein